jgi:hypothetical protein
MEGKLTKEQLDELDRTFDRLLERRKKVFIEITETNAEIDNILATRQLHINAVIAEEKAKGVANGN